MSRRHRSGDGSKGGRRVRVEFRSNRAARRRQKGLPAHLVPGVDDTDKLATPLQETIAPKGELSRKRTVVETTEAGTAGTMEGTVVAVRGLVAEVDAMDGQRYACTVRRVLRVRRIHERHPVAVGDRVRFAPTPVKGSAPPEGVIWSVLPRRTQLCRASEREAHLIAANVDQVIVVASAAQPPLKPSLIDRYLVSASAGMMNAVVCINKMDLDTSGGAVEVLERYRRIGYPVVAASVVTGAGIEELRQHLAGRSSVIAGQSGVGKSSLLNAIQPGLRLRVGDVCAESGKGRHTTTTAQLLKLDIGGYVVDTPGIRAFELAMVPVGELEAHFVEFVDRVAECKFADCTHIHEAGCAIRAAVERGEIHAARYQSYVRLFKERCGLVPAEEYEDAAYSRR